MDIARSLFRPRVPEGYIDGKSGTKIVTAVDEDNDDVFLPTASESCK